MLTLEDQIKWPEVFENCDYTLRAAEAEYKIPAATISSWCVIKLDQDGGYKLAKPSKKYAERAIAMINDMADKPKLQKHPSFGYATPEQVERLNTMGLGPERDALLKQIEKVNKQYGKRK